MVTGRAPLDLIVVCLVVLSYAPAGQYLLVQGGRGMAVVRGLSSSRAAPLNTPFHELRAAELCHPLNCKAKKKYKGG